MPRPLRVFLCHASQDKPAVWKIYRFLKQKGVQPWLDRADLLPGQNWEVEIPKAIGASDVILVCVSKNSVNKEGYVQKEIVFALDKALEKPEGTIFIIPVKLEDCDIPRRLGVYQWVDYYHSDGRKRLLMGLNSRAQSLGEEISPVVMEDIRQKTSRPKPPKPKMKPEEPEPINQAPIKYETEEEPQKEIPAETLPSPSMVTLPENKTIQRKPFTKILDPSSLVLQKTPPVESNQQNLRKPAVKLNYRWDGIIGIVLLLLVFSGFGLKSLLNQLPTATLTPMLSKNTETPNPPTETSLPLSPTRKPTETPSPTPTLGIGSTMVSERDGMVMVYVPAGEFTMGSDAYSEQPTHQVYLDTFWIDQTEVTNGMYQKCVEADKCAPPARKNSNTQSSYFGNPEFENFPVIYISWNDAVNYCAFVNRRLPTEAEWEKAARGTNGNIYPWGNENPNANLLNHYYTNINDTTEVGSYPDGASPYGAYDMAGNVFEWVNDWYDENYYSSSPLSNPQGPETGDFRTLRGGSWSYDIGYFYTRTTYRYRGYPGLALNVIGFRCALSS